MRFNNTDLSTGTGFVYQSENSYFIVTAWHNLTGLHSEHMSPLSKNSGIPNNLIASIAFYKDSHIARLPLIIPLVDEDKSLFLVHPRRWPRIDVAVIPIDLMADYSVDFDLDDNNKATMSLSSILTLPDQTSLKLCPIQQYLLPDKNICQEWLASVDVTEELFIPGYPLNIHDYYSQPVWKRATIATSVQSGWNGEPKFLVDTASKSGMSGSPVLYLGAKGEVKVKNKTYMRGGETAILTGVYVGRLGVSREADPQIGTVWNQSVIDEIIKASCYEYLPDRIQIHTDELERKAIAVLESCEQNIAIESIDSDSSTYHYVYNKLMREIDGRASPDRVDQAIKKIVAFKMNA